LISWSSPPKRFEGEAVNLKELSRQLGLSQTTVSRALNGYPDVGDETRRRVEEAARLANYRPNSSARRLALGRTGALGIFFPMAGGLSIDPHFAEFLLGIAEHVADTEIDVAIIPTRRTEATILRASRLRSVDALIVSGPTLDESRLEVVRRSGVPFVVHGRFGGKQDYAFLDIDNEGAFRRATELLLDFGHRRIALLNGHAALAFAASRAQGWREAHHARGLDVPEGLHREGVMSEENGHAWTLQLLAGEQPPTAILCSSIIQALGCCRALRERGLDIGRSISVVAHDDDLPVIRPQTMTPPLTTLSSSIKAAGQRIAEIALALANGGHPADFREVWPVEIVFRGSVGPAPSSGQEI
jgi:LacI family transcriptional regulator